MTTSADVYRCTPRQARLLIPEIIEAGLVPFLQSSPGMGKSSIMRAIADDFRLKLIDHRISTSSPVDATGLPRFDKAGNAHFAPFTDIFPIEGMPLPGQALVEGAWTTPTHDGWMLFLDELNSGSKSTMAAFYKVILDKMVGQKRLHDRVVITAAGNLMTDRAITTQLGTALQSRVITLEMETNFMEWLEDIAIPQNYDPRIIGYLSENKGDLMDFRPDHQEKTFCCPRTWEFMNALIKGKSFPVTRTTDGRTLSDMDQRIPLYAGTITSGVAIKFVQFTKVAADVVKLADVLSSPSTCPVPSDTSLKWMTTTMLMLAVDPGNFGAIGTYIDRLPDLSFKILFYRGALVRDPNLRHHQAFIRASSQIARYLA